MCCRGRDNAYDLGSATLRWRSGYFGTSVVVGTSVSLVAGTPDRLEYSGDGIVRTGGYLAVETGGWERLRVTATGEVVVQNQEPTGATKVIIRAGANQSGVNLLEWVDDLGNTQGVIDANGLVGIGTTAPVQRLHVVGNGSVSAVFVEGGVGVGTDNPLATLHVYDEGTLTLGATRVIIQAGANQSGVNLLEWQDNLGNILGVIDAGGLVGIGTSTPAATLDVVGTAQVSGNTSIGGSLTVAGDATVSGTTVALPNIPSGSTATEVLVWNGGDVERRSAAGLISGFAWMLGGNDLTLLGEQTLGTLSAHDLPIITAGTERVRITQAGHVLPGADNAYDLGSATLRWRSGYFGTSVVVGTSVSLVAGTPDRLEYSGDGIVRTGGYLAVETGGWERLRVTATGEVVVQNQEPTGATKVIIRAGANQSGVNLLEWVDDLGNTQGVIDANGLVGIGTTAPVQRLHVVGNGSVSAVFVEGGVGVGTDNPLATLHVYDEGTLTLGATRVIIQAGANQSGVNLLEWQDNLGNILGVIDAGGLVGIGTSTPAATLDVVGTAQVSGNTSIGGSLTVAGDATVSGTTVALPNIPSGSTATEVLVWNGGDVERRSAAGLISGFAWMLGGNDLTLLGEQTLGTLSAHDLPIITAGTERVRITQAGHVLPGADNAYDLGSATLRWRSGYFGTSVVVGTSVSLVAGTPDRLEYSGDGIVRTGGYLAVETGGWERLRVTATGEVVVQNQEPTGATKVIIRAGANQSGVNLLEWQDNLGNILGVIDAGGLVGIGTSTPAATLDVVGTAQVSGNTSIGGSLTVAGDATVSGTTVALPNIPSGSTATEVLVWNGGDVERRSAAGLISGFAWMLGGNDLTLLGEQTLGTLSAHDLPIITAGTERVRITQAGHVLPGADNAYDLGSATLRWRSGYFGTSVVVGTSVSLVAGTPDRLEYSGDGIVRTGGYLAVETGGWERLRVTATGEVVVQNQEPTGATKVIIRAGANQSGVNLLEWQDNLGNILGVIDAGGLVGIGTSTPAATLDVVGTAQVSGNTSIGGSLTVAGDATVSGTTVALPNIPSGSTATEVLVWNGGDVERRSAAGLISGFAWMLGGNDLTLLGEQTLGTLSAHDLPIITAGTERVRITQAGHVLPGADNAYDLGSATLRWRSGYFGTSVVVGTSVSLVAGTPDRLEYSGDGIVRTGGYLAVETGGWERLRVTATGEVVVQNQEPTGATKVIIRAGANQSGVNLLEWVDDLGNTQGVIDANGLVGIGTTAPVQRLHVVGNGSVSAVFVEGGVGVGTDNPLATLHVYDEGTLTLGATRVIIQAGANQSGVNLLEWQDNLGNILGVIDAGGLVGIGTSTPAATLDVVGTAQVSGNTSIGGSLTVAGDATVSGTTVALPNIPSGSTATEVLVWNGGDVERRSAAGLISGFAWMLGGNDLTLLGEQTLGTLSAHDLPIITAGTERVRITQAGHVLPGADNAYDLGSATLRWRSGYFGTSVVVGTSVSLVAGTPDRLEYSGDGIVRTGGYLAVETGGWERLRVTATGEVVVQNQEPTGATKVIIRAGANQSGVNLLEWQDNLGNILGVIDAGGLVGIGTSTPAATLDVVGTAQVSGNTSIGGSLTVAGDATVSGTTVALPNIPSGSTATEVLVWNGGDVERRSAAGLISGFAWMLGGNDLTLLGEQTLGTLSAHDLPIITAGTERVRITQAGHVLPGADNAYDLGSATLRWRSGYFGTSVVVGTSVSLVAGTPDRLEYSGDGIVRTGGYLAVETGGWERLRVTATGEVVVQNQEPTGATKVIIRAGANQSGVNLLEWQDNLGNILGVIDAGGLVGIGTSTPAATLDVVGTAQVSGNTSIGGSLTVAGDATVSGTTVALPNIPSGSTATEVLVWNGGDVERRSAAGLISGFAWMLGGNDLTLLGEQTLGTLSAHDLPIITAGTERVRITQAGHVLPGADNAYDLGSATLRWRSGYFGTSVVVGTSVSLVAGTPDRLEYSGDGIVRTGGYLAVETGGWERLRVTATGEVVVQNQEPTGATKVIIRAGANQSGVNLLEWVDDLGNTQGVIDANGLVGIGTTAPVQRLHVVGNGSVSAVFVEGGVGVGTDNPLATLHVYDEGTLTLGATRVIIQAGANQSGVNLLEWQDNLGNILGVIDAGGLVGIGTSTPAATLDVVGTAQVSGNTSIGGSLTVAGDATVSGTTVALPNIPSGSTATEVLVWNGGDVERRSAAGLISGFAWMLGGNDLTLLGEQTLGTLSAHDLPIITAGTERVRITQAGHVLPGADNAYDLGSATLRWRSGYFGTSVVVGTSVSLVAGTPDRLEYSGDGIVRTGGYLAVETGGWERLRVTATGEVVVQNQEPTGATKVIIQAGANQSGVNLLEWVDDLGNTQGVIDANGLVGIGTTAPVQRLHVVGNGSVSAVFVEGGVGVGTDNPLATLHVYDEGTLTLGATRVIIQAGANQAGVNLLEWQNAVGTVLGGIDDAGNLFVNTNTTLGDAAGDVVTVNAGTVALPNIPALSTATEVLVWNGGNVEHRSASGLISGFAWMLGGNDLTLLGEQTLGTLSAHDLPIITAGTEKVRITQAGHVLPGADNAYDLGENTTPLRWRSGYFGTQVVVGTSVSLVAGTPDRLEYSGDGIVRTGGYLAVETGGAERLRVTATGEVVVQNQEPTGATKVIIQAGANQSGVNLLEWVDDLGNTQGVIDANGLVGIGTTTPVQRLHVVGNGSVSAVFVEGGVGVGTDNPLATLHVYDEGTLTLGATRVIIQAGANQTGVNLLEWQNAVGTVLGGIDDAGNLFVNTNTTLGDAAGDVVTVYAGTVALPNIPTAAATDEVLRIDPATGEVKRSTAAAVISAGIIKGSFSIAASGSSFTISVAPADIQPGAIVTVTLVGPSGGTIYPLMVTNVNAGADEITVESSGTIPGGAGYAIHYIIINP
jgi:hypothetical protein